MKYLVNNYEFHLLLVWLTLRTVEVQLASPGPSGVPVNFDASVPESAGKSLKKKRGEHPQGHTLSQGR